MNTNLVKRHPTKPTHVLIKQDNHPFADNGWVECVMHHHQDARSLIPVPLVIHENFSHIGGASILRNADLNELKGFFNGPNY